MIQKSDMQQLETKLQNALDPTKEPVFLFDDHFYRIHSIKDHHHVVYLIETDWSGNILVTDGQNNIRHESLEAFQRVARVVSFHAIPS